MEIIRYNQNYQFHFWSGLDTERLARFLNRLPLDFRFEQSQHEFWYFEQDKHVYWLNFKTQPHEEKPLPSSQANYYIHWGPPPPKDYRLEALQLAQKLSNELETVVWLVDGDGRILWQSSRLQSA